MTTKHNTQQEPTHEYAATRLRQTNRKTICTCCQAQRSTITLYQRAKCQQTQAQTCQCCQQLHQVLDELLDLCCPATNFTVNEISEAIKNVQNGDLA